MCGLPARDLRNDDLHGVTVRIRMELKLRRWVSLEIKSVGRCWYEPAVNFLKRWPEDQITIFDGDPSRVVNGGVIFQCRFRKGERLFQAGLIFGQPAFVRVPSVLVRRVDLTGQLVGLDGKGHVSRKDIGPDE